MNNASKVLAASLLLLPAIGAAASAQGLRAVEPLHGYSCMSLNLTEDQDENAAPPIRQAPSQSAAQISRASALVIVAEPRRTRNGFVAVLTLDGRSGWVEADKLRPYHNVSNPGTRCIVAKMSNGRPGFTFSK